MRLPRVLFPILLLLPVLIVPLWSCGGGGMGPVGPRDVIPPARVTDLTATPASDQAVGLQWTAPGDDATTGTAATYDLRYAQRDLTNDGWGLGATVSAQDPIPAGQTQILSVDDLTAQTTYYFSIRTGDESGNWSSWSNVASAQTLAPGETDTIPPNRILNLRAVSATDRSVLLGWTAPGDDGISGTAFQYDLRYALSALSGDAWLGADATDPVPGPQPFGSDETFSAGGLQPRTEYFFALRASDEAGNWSSWSPAAAAMTLAEAGTDTIPPDAVVDLELRDIADVSVVLTWTAPGDDEGTGQATAYDVRYSTDLIDDTSWDDATPVSVPPPGTPGLAESVSITGLDPDRTYHFAVRTRDEVQNEAALSNVATALTFPLLQETPPVFALSYGGLGSGDGEIRQPRGLAVDASGFVYVADRGNHRVQKFDADGFFVRAWGGRSQELISLFDSPKDVAARPAGGFYVTDWVEDRVLIFDDQGTRIGQMGDGLDNPQSLDVDGAGNIYVADTGNDRIQKLASDGTVITNWGASGIFEGEFDRPQGVAVDGQGNVYVADTRNNRIQKFDSDGTFRLRWGFTGSLPGQFNRAEDVAVDAAGNVYVADRLNHRVQKFDGDGLFLASWGVDGTGDADFQNPVGIAVGINGAVSVADNDAEQIKVFSSEGVFQDVLDAGSWSDGAFFDPLGLGASPDGKLYAVDTGNARIVRFSTSAGFERSWKAEQTPEEGLFDSPAALAVDRDGNLVITDSGNYRLQVFDPDGTFVEARRVPVGVQPLAIAASTFGQHVAANINRIYAFTAGGGFETSFSTRFIGAPADLAASSIDGTVFAVGATPYVVAYQNNVEVDSWQNPQFGQPSAVALDAAGNVYIADRNTLRIFKFLPDGTFLTGWGVGGTREGQLARPSALAVDAGGAVYVADEARHRVIKFAAPDQ